MGVDGVEDFLGDVCHDVVLVVVPDALWVGGEGLGGVEVF